MNTEKITFIKKATLFNKVIFVDGTAHVGKLLLGPLLSAYENVQMHKVETFYEHLCVLHHYGKISLDAAVTFMRNFLDESLYNAEIGRNVNIRPSDYSSVFQGFNQQRFLENLFSEEGEAAVRRIRRNRSVYQNLTHEILGFIEPCFAAFGDRLHVVEVIRHPADMVNCWLRRGWGGNRLSSDPRSFIISFDYQGRQTPYYAFPFKEKFHAMNGPDRVINCIDSCNRRIMRTYSRLPPRWKKKVLFVKFEHLVTDSRRELARIAAFAGLKETPHLKKVMVQQRCPRVIDVGGRDALIAGHLAKASLRGRRLLERMVADYETFDPRRPEGAR